MTTPGQSTLHSQRLGCLRVVNFFLARIGMADHLQTYLPSTTHGCGWPRPR